MAVRVGDEAQADIREIADYIARRDRLAARRWATEVRGRVRRLGGMPGMGAPRFDVLPGLRVLPFRRYLILYRPEGADTVILRVVHGARAWETLV